MQSDKKNKWLSKDIIPTLTLTHTHTHTHTHSHTHTHTMLTIADGLIQLMPSWVSV